MAWENMKRRIVDFTLIGTGLRIVNAPGHAKIFQQQLPEVNPTVGIGDYNKTRRGCFFRDKHGRLNHEQIGVQLAPLCLFFLSVPSTHPTPIHTLTLTHTRTYTAGIALQVKVACNQADIYRLYTLYMQGLTFVKVPRGWLSAAHNMS